MANFHPGKFSSLLFASTLLWSSPAWAQLDLSGVWTPSTQEDQPERGPGPDLVDYPGLPINAEARQWALSWDPDRLSSSGASMPGPHRRLYLSRPAATPHLGGARSANPGPDRHPQLHQHLRAEPHHLDGQPPASAGLRGAHLDGIFHRPLGRQHPDRLHHPYQAGLAPPQRAPLQRR